MVERPIKKSERQAKATTNDGGDSAPPQPTEQRRSERPARKDRDRDQDKGARKAEPVPVGNLALMRGPKPSKFQPPVVQESAPEPAEVLDESADTPETPIEDTPAPEVAAAVEAAPVVEAVEAAPVVEVTPVVEADPVVEAVEAAPVVEAVEADPVVEAVETAPVVEVTPAVETAPVVEAVEADPVVEVTLAVEAAPLAEPATPDPVVEAPEVTAEPAPAVEPSVLATAAE